MPKYIFPLSKCLVVGINFLLTLIPLYAVILIESTKYENLSINIYHLALPYAYICLFFFTLGVSLILACVSVFLRDMVYIYGIVTTIWTYLTPIMYDINMIGNPTLAFLMKLNPMYLYINFARQIILGDQNGGYLPSGQYFLACGGSALIVLLAGIAIFKWKQDKFIYYT